MQRRILILILMLFLITFSLFAGTTGKLAGRVKDDGGNPIPFANIILEGTQIGTQTKENGQFIIINIPPGTYNVLCTQIGFASQKITGVKIYVDETTIQNITMVKSAMEVEGYQVTEARIELISKSNTSSGLTMTSDTIEDIAVDDIEGLIAIQAGAVQIGGELHIRGGRANEVVYSVDGMSVSDPVDGGAALTIDTDAIQNMKVMTGGFTAEYGNAQSGIVNIVTKSGSRDYSGKIEFTSDHLFSGVDNSNSDVVKFALGGPVFGPFSSAMRDKFTFFLNGAANWYDGRYKDYYNSDPNEELEYLYQPSFTPRNPYEDREQFIEFDLGDRNYNAYNVNLKTKYVFNPTQNLTLAVRGDKTHRYPYSHFNKYALEHYIDSETEQRQYAATYDHLFNSQMNLKIKASIYQKTIKQGPRGISRDSYFSYHPEFDDEFAFYMPDENNFAILKDYMSQNYIVESLTDDGIIDEGAIYDWTYTTAFGQQEVGGYFNEPGSIYGAYFDDENRTISLRSDFEYQVNEVHGLKTGLEIIKHKIKKDRLFNPWVVDAFRHNAYLQGFPVDAYLDTLSYLTANPETMDVIVLAPGDYVINDIEVSLGDSTYFYSSNLLFEATLAGAGESDGYEADPWQAAYYLQDQMEWEGLIINAGLRFDLWYLGKEYKILQDGGDYKTSEFDKDEQLQVMISPRFGISHPISEKSVMHFAYNYQNQLPQFQYVFTTARPEDAITSNTQIVVGVPTLEPQITVTYEVGFQHQLSEDYVMDITTYFKNIYNYVSTMEVVDPDDNTISWYEYISEDYGSTRGIDFNLQKMLSNFISGSASYSLSWADGNNSDTVIQDESTSLREFPLDWDIRHNFTFNLGFTIGRGEEFYIPFTGVLLPFSNFSMNFLYNIASGRPYTAINENDNVMETNQERYPYTENADLRITKTFNFSEKTYIRFYANINNIFNKRNYLEIYPKTGSPYDDGEDLTVANTDPPFIADETQYIHDLAVYNPGNVSTGRTITVGMSFNW